MKKMVEAKMKRKLGSDAGSSYQYGIKKGNDIQKYHKKYNILEEWSYYEDKDLKPSILKIFKHFKIVTRSLWTVLAEIK